MKQKILRHYININPKSNYLSTPSDDNKIAFPRLSSYDGMLHLNFFAYRRKYSMLSTYVNHVHRKVRYKRFRRLSEYDQIYNGRLKVVDLESSLVVTVKRYNSTKQYPLSMFGN